MKDLISLLFGIFMGYMIMSFVNFTFNAGLWTQADRIMSVVTATFFAVITYEKLKKYE